MGIFDRINAVSIPGIHPVMYLAFEIELRPAEIGSPFEMQMKLVDADGKRIFEITANGEINTQGSTGDLLRIPQTLALGSVPLPKAGGYSLDIFINKDHKKHVSFLVVVQDVNQLGLPQ